MHSAEEDEPENLVQGASNTSLAPPPESIDSGTSHKFTIVEIGEVMESAILAGQIGVRSGLLLPRALQQISGGGHRKEVGAGGWP